MIFAIAGSVFSIGGAFSPELDAVSAINFAGQAWVPVGNCESLGSAGETWSTYDTTHMGSTRTTQRKGLLSSAPMELTFGLDSTDPGQLALLAALKSEDAFAFMVSLPDATSRLFLGLVTGMSEILEGGASSVAKVGVTIMRNTNLVKVI